MLKAEIYCVFGLLNVLFLPVDLLDFRSEPLSNIWMGEGRREEGGDVSMKEREGERERDGRERDDPHKGADVPLEEKRGVYL